MKRIAVVCEYGTLNGGEQSLLAVLAHVPDDLDITVLAPAEGRLAGELQTLGIAHRPLTLHDQQGRRRPAAESREHLTEAIHALSPQLVHANSLSMSRLLGSVREAMPTTCTGHLRDIIRLSQKAVDDLNRLDQLVAVSRATRDFHVSQGVEASRIGVCYNGVDCDRFQPRENTGWLHRELSLDPSATLIATIGQIGPRKGQDLLIKAVCRLSDQWPKLHLLIIGERYSTKTESREFELDLHRTVAAAGLSARVHWLGYRTDLDRLLNEIDLLVQSARQEPLGRVLLEGLAAGVPIIATDVGGTREIIDDNVSGWLLTPDDAELLAAAIARLSRDAETRSRLSAAARLTALERFSIEDHTSQLLCIWNSAVSGTSCRQRPAVGT